MTLRIKFNGVESTFQELRDELGEFTLENLDERSIDLLGALREATPVRTGRARNGWRLEATRRDLATNEYETAIVNQVPYVPDLNQGSSRQAPARFIEETALQYFDPDGVIVRRR